MKWKNESPWVKGLYWYRKDHHHKPILLEVEYGHCWSMECRKYGKLFYKFMPSGGQWAGPVKPPDESKSNKIKIDFHDMSYENIMRQWDYWRAKIAEGDKSSAPRDWFEAILDYFEEKIKE